MRPVRSRRSLLASGLVSLVVVGLVSAFGASRAQDAGPTVNVRNYGAKGDGITNDTGAIQRANDAVANTGGTVHFPAGTYSAMGIKQDSNVHFLGGAGATLRHRNGTTPTPIVTNRLPSTRGSITAGSRSLTVASANKMLPGAIVGVRAAGELSEVQKTTLNVAVTAGAGLFMLKEPHGWRVNTRNYLWVDNEVISYQGMSGNTLTGVRRAQFGTKAASHAAGARVSQAQGLIARIMNVAGTTIELDRPALKGVKSANVWTGAVNLSVRGLTIDGKRPTDPSPNNTVRALHYTLARWVLIENNTFIKASHSAVTFDQGTSDSLIANNVFLDNGNPGDGMGSNVWLYRSVTANTVENNHMSGDSHLGIAVDDRTSTSSEWDGSSDENLLLRNVIDIPPIDQQSAIYIGGSNRNQVVENDVRSTMRGMYVARSTQGVNPGESEGNVVRDNRLSGHRTGLYVTASYNAFERNLIELTERPIVDTGTGNTFA